MKNIALFVLLFLCVVAYAQQDTYVLVPKRYEFQKSDDQFQLNSLTKFLLEKQGFKVFFQDELPENLLKNPCELLKANVLNDSGVFASRLQLTLTDCLGNQVFVSEKGVSREKEFKKAYQEALRDAVSIGNKLALFKSNYSKRTVAEKPQIQENKNQESAPHEVLYAQAKNGGYQLVDSTPKVVMRLSNTSLPDVYIAQDEQKNYGILYKKESIYVFEFVENEDVKQKIFQVKF